MLARRRLADAPHQGPICPSGVEADHLLGDDNPQQSVEDRCA
jgi:hypothetical protein